MNESCVFLLSLACVEFWFVPSGYCKVLYFSYFYNYFYNKLAKFLYMVVIVVVILIGSPVVDRFWKQRLQSNIVAVEVTIHILVCLSIVEEFF